MCRGDKTTTRPPGRVDGRPLNERARAVAADAIRRACPPAPRHEGPHRARPVKKRARAAQEASPSGRRPAPAKTPASRLALWLASSALALIFLARHTTPVAAVDCFKCSSRNGSNPACEDPFHNLNTSRVTLPILPDPQPSVIYHTPCYAGRKNRDGLFPASACIKLTGVFDTTGETLVVRHCALDSGSLTQDTELARMSHCGKFQFEGDLLRGCVLACPEDACNSARATALMNRLPLFVAWLALALAALSW